MTKAGERLIEAAKQARDIAREFGDDAWWCETCNEWTPPGHLQCAKCATPSLSESEGETK